MDKFTVGGWCRVNPDWFCFSGAGLPGLSWKKTGNGIWIHSAVLPQYQLQTDRQTNKPTDRWTDQQSPEVEPGQKN